MSKTKSHTISDFYEAYLLNIDLGTIYEVEYKIYRRILVDYFKHLRDQIIELGKSVKLPYKLGHLFIVKRRPLNYDPTCRATNNTAGVLIDFQSTKLYGKTIFHMNEHTNGYKYRFKWDKITSNVANSTRYQLKMTRANKRRLAQILRIGLRDYIELS